MKSLIVVLILQIFIGHSMSDAIDDNREFAMNAIKECMDQTKVIPEDLKSALETKDYYENKFETFTICYEQRMEGIKSLAEHCMEKNAKVDDFLKCYYGIVDEYLREIFLNRETFSFDI